MFLQSLFPFTRKSTSATRSCIGVTSVKQSSQYREIPQDLESDGRKDRTPRALLWGRFLFSVLCKVVLAATAGWGLLQLGHRAFGVPRASLASCYCGKNATEAISLGCIFDEIMPAWLPPHCVDMALLNEYATSGSGPSGEWDYYYDAEGTKRITAAEMSMLSGTGADLWMTQRWHMTHCIYVWRRMHEHWTTGMALTTHEDSEHHIVHCAKAALEQIPLSNISTHIYLP